LRYTLAYCLPNQAEVDAYVQVQNELAERVRAENEAAYTPEQRAYHKRLRTLILTPGARPG